MAQLAATFWTHFRFVSVLVNVIAGWVFTPTSTPGGGQAQVLGPQEVNK